MKKRFRKSVMLVPLRGTRVKPIRVPLWAVFVLLLMATTGIAGYFVSLDGLILTEQKLAQKNSLEQQNERLQSNIGATLRLLDNLRMQTERLQVKKEQYKGIIGLPASEVMSGRPQRKAPATPMSSSSMLQYISDVEVFVASFAAAGGDRHSLFDTIPVLRPVDPAISVISRRFGMGRCPFTGKQKMHYGTDFAAEIGTPVVAAASGIVIRVENDPIWGRRVTIRHGQDFRTVYAHLGTVTVVLGKAVRRGDAIGAIGMSSRTTGPHIHYEIWYKDEQLNPEDYIFPEKLIFAGL